MNLPPAVSAIAADNKLNAAANAAATVTFAAVSDRCHVITGVHWSYDAAPTGGKLQIKDDTTVVREWDITAAGPGFIEFPRPIKITVNKDMNIVLAAGGSGVTGKVGALNHWTESA